MSKRLHWLIVICVLVGVVALTACNNAAEETETETAATAVGEDVTSYPVTETGDTAPALAGTVKTLYVGPSLVDCTGVGPMQCMQVKETPDGEYTLFYEQIEGFTFEEGYEYELQVNVETIENPPADGSSLKYTLVSVVSQTPSTPSTTTTTSEPAAATGETALVGSLWQLQSYQGTSALTSTEVTAIFGADGSLSGSAGCNSYSTSYTVDGANITINGAIASTMMACLEDSIMQQETAFLAALPTATTWSVADGVLTLNDASGAAVAVFTAVETTPLFGTLWQLNSFNNGLGGVTSLVAGTEITAVFAEDGSLGGNAGCNTYFTSFQVDGQNITIDSQIGSTMMACPENIMQQETAYLAALPTAATFVIQGDSLELRHVTGSLIASYTAVASTPLTGTTWNLTGYNNGQGAVVSPNASKQGTAVFGEDGSLSGSTGCNNFNTTYTLDGANITINAAIASTRMACDEPSMQQETAILAALPTATTYSIQGDALELRDATGALVASFTAAPAAASSLVGVNWLVTNFNNGNQAVVTPITGSELTLTFDASGNVEGSSGCNRFFGPYQMSDNSLTIGFLGTTRAFCEEPAGMMDQETQFLVALQTAATYSIQNNMLEIRTADDAMALVAVPVP